MQRGKNIFDDRSLFRYLGCAAEAGCSSRRGAELKSQVLDSPTTQGATQGLLKGYPRATQVQEGECFAPKVPCRVVVVAVKARGHLQVSLVPSCPSRATPRPGTFWRSPNVHNAFKSRINCQMEWAKWLCGWG